MEIIKTIILIIISYLIGSISFSYVLCKKIKKIDIRTVGSKNIGATNAGRILGKRWFFVITIMDAFKGFFPVLYAKYLMNEQIIIQHPLIPIIVGLGAMLGHMYSIYLNFQGGKGVAVSAGIVIALNYWIVIICLFIFIIAVLISKYISLGSITASLFIPISLVFTHKIIYKTEIDIYMLVFCFILCFYIIFKHRGNISRLLSGTERKWGEIIKTKQ